MSHYRNAFCLFCLMSCFLSLVSGCFQSDAARMEEMRKYAGAGVKDDDDDDAAVQQVATNYVPPSRTDADGSGTSTAVTPSAGVSQAATASPATPAVAAGNAAKPAAASPAPPAMQGISDTKSPPATPLSEVERRQMTIDNMRRIATALEAFREHEKKGGSYPGQYMADPAGQPLLSWRVRLLPYMGYADLFNKFKHNERWDSAHNQQLISQIPSVYQSPERFDVYTNYLVPVSGGAAFDGPKPKPIRRWEDGLENSIILAEVNDDHSVIWTQPSDWEFDPRQPKKGLGGLRKDGFFAVWGGGELTHVPNQGGNVRNAFTVDGGDITTASLKKPAFAAPGGIANAFQRNTSGGLSAGPDTNTAATIPGANSVAPGARGVQPATSGQVDSMYVAAANELRPQEAFNEGRESDAVEMFYADALAGNAAAFGQYRWVAGLSRPSPVVRYGIGVDYTGTGAKAAQQAVAVALAATPTPGRVSRSGSKVEQVFQKLTGDFGQQIIGILQSQPLHCPFEIVQPEPRARRSRDDDDDIALDQPAQPASRIAPGIQFLGIDSPRRLLAAAEKNQVDVLVFFEINRRNRSKDVRVSLVDVMRRKKILNTQKLNTRDVSAAKADLLEDDPTLAVLDEIAEFVAAKLQPAALPVGLKSNVAEKRVTNLSQSQSNPLQRLAEIQFYRQLGLIDLRQQSDAFGAILDENNALVLVAGSPQEKLAALEPLLPRQRSATTSVNSPGWRGDRRSL